MWHLRSACTGVPDTDAYQKERFDLFLKTRELTGIPLYIGEWNNVVRTQEGGIFKINPAASDLTEDNAEKILETLNNAKVWATLFGNGTTGTQIHQTSTLY